ncbi:ATP-binding protein, partial [Patescibacteria group bacterium]|nr:ATP-binding protein [Patescibacteria group bacterium]
MDLKTVKIKSQHFKAFGEEEQGFDSVLPINLIVGKNNTGKSALIDTINHCTAPQDFPVVGRENKTPLFFVSYPIEDDVISIVFPSSTSGGAIGGNYNEYGKKWSGKYITCRVDNQQNHYERMEKNDSGEEVHTMFNEQLNRTIKNPMRGYIFRRLLADRDISEEPVSNNFEVKPDGKGATAVVQRIYNLASENPALIEKDLLEALNTIFFPDFQFTRIFPREVENGKYEIFLEEEKKGLIGLSNSGSGLKTILLVLINTILLPRREKMPLSKYIFAFEELENNLHPGTQRRL